MPLSSNSLVVFFAWQSEILKSANRRAIEASLRAAASRLETNYADRELTVHIDKDTSNRSGSPAIADTILENHILLPVPEPSHHSLQGGTWEPVNLACRPSHPYATSARDLGSSRGTRAGSIPAAGDESPGFEYQPDSTAIAGPGGQPPVFVACLRFAQGKDRRQKSIACLAVIRTAAPPWGRCSWPGARGCRWPGTPPRPAPAECPRTRSRRWL